MNVFYKGLLGILSTLALGLILIILEKVVDIWWDSNIPNNPPVEIAKPADNPPVAITKPADNPPVAIAQPANNPPVAIAKPLDPKPLPKPLNTETSHPVSKCKNGNLATKLKCLDNPKTPFTVLLWLDKPGKKDFKHRKKVKIGYQVDGSKKKTEVYFTLLNISPSGKLSMVFSESIETGKTYGKLKKGKHATSVKEIKLEKGQEYFKAIVTSEPINWKMFIRKAVNGSLTVKFWNTVELEVNVK